MAVVSLLVTDIVESTRLWLEHERAMVEDLKVHDELVRRVVGVHGGSIFKHTVMARWLGLTTRSTRWLGRSTSNARSPR